MEDHIEHAPYTLLYEAVFELKEAVFKLDVTRWVPRLMQSVIGKYINPLLKRILSCFTHSFACHFAPLFCQRILTPSFKQVPDVGHQVVVVLASLLSSVLKVS